MPGHLLVWVMVNLFQALDDFNKKAVAVAKDVYIDRPVKVLQTYKALLPKALGGDDIKLVNPTTGIVKADVTVPVKGAVIAAAVGPALIANPAPVLAVGRAVIANPKTTLAIGAAGFVATGLSRSEEGREVLKNAPGEGVKLADDALNVISELPKGKEAALDAGAKFAKEHPVATAAGGLLALGGIGVAFRGLASTIATFQNTKALRESTQSAVLPPLQKTTVQAEKLLGSPPMSTQPVPISSPERSITRVAPRRKKKALPVPQFRNIFKPSIVIANRNG